MDTTSSTTAAYTVAQVMARTGIGRDSIYAAIRAGKLAARKYGRRTIITDSDLRSFLDGLPRADRAA